MGTVPIWSFLAGFHTQKLWCLSSRGFACSESQRAAGGIRGVGDSRFLSLSQVLTVRFSPPIFLALGYFPGCGYQNHQLLCRRGRITSLRCPSGTLEAGGENWSL